MHWKLILLIVLPTVGCGGNVEVDAAGSPATGGGAGASGTGGTGAVDGDVETGGGPSDSGGASGSTGGTGGNGGVVTSCPDAGGPSMVLLPEGYCIDSTEVTRGQYAAWRATQPSTDGQKDSCKWNWTFRPAEECEVVVKLHGQPCGSGECADAPQTCVDWCDAYAYCATMGKRLCGKIGGGKVRLDDFDDPTKSQWQSACSSGGTYSYPYGTVFDDSACNSQTGLNLTEVESLSACQSEAAGYQGVYDMSGNAWEWEDSCGADTDPEGFNDGSEDPCRLRGGLAKEGTDYACDADYVVFRGYPGGGIRCCYP